jgi:hypothetical protein
MTSHAAVYRRRTGMLAAMAGHFVSEEFSFWILRLKYHWQREAKTLLCKLLRRLEQGIGSTHHVKRGFRKTPLRRSSSRC